MLNAWKRVLRPKEPPIGEWTDRSVGLIVFGTVDILFGIFYFCLSMMLLLVISVAGLGGIKPVHFWMALLFCFFLTGWYVWMGLGSIRGRHWARALLLVGAWITLFFGTLFLALLLFLLPEVYNVVADSGLLSPSAALTVLALTVGFIALLQLVFPVGLIAFYGSRSVAATCERMNPESCWTDRTPLPLLALSVVCSVGCFLVVFSATTNYTVFFFGRVLSGWPGVLITGFISIVCGYVGWGAYARKMHAWWGAYAMIVIISASMMLTFSEMDMESMYAHMNYTVEQIEQLQQSRLFSPTTLVCIICVWGVVASSYLVWVRDLFRPEVAHTTVFSYRTLKGRGLGDAAKGDASRVRMRLE